MRTSPTRTEGLLALGVFGRGSCLCDRIEMLLHYGRVFSPRVSRMRVIATVVALAGCMLAGAFAPTWIAFAQRIEFEVASVKPISDFRGFSLVPQRSGDRISWVANAQLVMFYAYKIRPFQLPQGKWLDGMCDIEAKVGGSPTEDQIRLMFQALLEDRFKLKAHWETKQLPVYSLVIAPGGPKLKDWRERETPWTVIGKPVREGQVQNYSSQEDPHHLVGHKVSTSKLVAYLVDSLRSAVVDKTGLTGDYDFELVWTSDEAPLDPPDPSILSSAMQRQLGLRLEAAKGPIDILNIDRLEKPDAN